MLASWWMAFIDFRFCLRILNRCHFYSIAIVDGPAKTPLFGQCAQSNSWINFYTSTHFCFSIFGYTFLSPAIKHLLSTSPPNLMKGDNVNGDDDDHIDARSVFVHFSIQIFFFLLVARFGWRSNYFSEDFRLSFMSTDGFSSGQIREIYSKIFHLKNQRSEKNVKRSE